MRLTVEEFARLMGRSVPKKKQSKHRNIKVYVLENGLAFDDKQIAESMGKISIVFDSKKEYNRWEELKLLQRAGKISNLQRQVKWIITEKTEYQGETIREISYKADFQYQKDGKTIVEDVKPFDVATNKYRTTKDFAMKWKLLKQKYPDISFVLY